MPINPPSKESNSISSKMAPFSFSQVKNLTILGLSYIVSRRRATIKETGTAIWRLGVEVTEE